MNINEEPNDLEEDIKSLQDEEITFELTADPNEDLKTLKFAVEGVEYLTYYDRNGMLVCPEIYEHIKG